MDRKEERALPDMLGYDVVVVVVVVGVARVEVRVEAADATSDSEVMDESVSPSPSPPVAAVVVAIVYCVDRREEGEEQSDNQGFGAQVIECLNLSPWMLLFLSP